MPCHILTTCFAALLSTTIATAQVSPAQDKRRADVAALIARIAKRRAAQQSLQLTLDLRGRLPAIGTEKARELRVLLRLQSMQLKSAADPKQVEHWSRIDAWLDTPQGPLHTEKVRTPDGIWIHQASEMTGERWLKVDKATMLKLDRAAEVLGRDGLDGGHASASVLDADFLRGLARSYDLVVEGESKVGEVVCTTVRGKLEKPSGQGIEDAVPTDRPDEVVLRYAKDSLVLYELVQLQRGRELSKAIVRDVDLAPKLGPSSFTISAPEGVKWVDILKDKMASIRVKLDLRRLEEWEEREKAKKEGKEEKR